MKRLAAFITATTVLVVFLVGVATGAWAQDETRCGTFTFNETLYILEGVEAKDHGLKYSIVGHYLWLKVSDNPDSYEDVVSIDLTDKQSPIRACVDGSTVGVTSILVEPQTNPEPAPQPVVRYVVRILGPVPA